MPKTKPPKAILHYAHPPPSSDQTADPEPGNYYVSVKDGSRVGLLAGPYRKHADAIAKIADCRELAEKHDIWAAFYSFGTVKMPEDYTTPGIFAGRV